MNPSQIHKKNLRSSGLKKSRTNFIPESLGLDMVVWLQIYLFAFVTLVSTRKPFNFRIILWVTKKAHFLCGFFHFQFSNLNQSYLSWQKEVICCFFQSTKKGQIDNFFYPSTLICNTYWIWHENWGGINSNILKHSSAARNFKLLLPFLDINSI